MQDIISLYRNYPKYDNLHDIDLQHYIKPSIYLKQYKKHYHKDKLVGFTNWAYLSDYASKHFQKTGIIKYNEWNSAQKFGSDKIINWLRTDNKKIYRNTHRVIKDNWAWVE